MGKDLSLIIANDKNRGILRVSTFSDFEGKIIKKLLIFLDNGTRIVCIDRNIYDTANHTTSTIYYLTEQEIEFLKSSNINTIRFSYSTETSYENTKSFTVDNSGVSDIPTIKKTRINFPAIFTKHF